MRLSKKTFAGTIFAVAFVMMVGISAVALWINDCIPFDNARPVAGEEVEDFTLYPATDENGKWGYIDADGNWIVAAEYDSAELFWGSIAWVEKDGLWGAVNDKGGLVIDCIYEEKYQQLDEDSYRICVAVSGNSKSIYNNKGEKIFGLENGQIGDLDGGLIAFSRNVDGIDNWGYVDIDGKVVISPSYKAVGGVGLTHAVAITFDDEMVLVKRSDGTETPLPDNVDLYGMGSNMLLYSENGLYGYLNMDGQVAIPAKFVEAEAFSNNAAVVKTETGYGLIDEAGNFIVEPSYAIGENVGNGYFMMGSSVTGLKTIFDKEGIVVAEKIVNANAWHDGILNVETETATRFIEATNGLIDGVSMANRSTAVYYGNRIAVCDINGVSYYDHQGNLLETYGQTVSIGNSGEITSFLESPDAYLEISYPEVTTSDSNLQDKYAKISDRLKENALSDYANMYKDNDGSVNYMVRGAFDYSVAGSVVTVLQKTSFVDEASDVEYEVLCFDADSGEMYNINSLFLPAVNWRSDFSKLLVDAYIEQSTYITDRLNQDAVAVLEKTLDRNTGFLLQSDGISIHVPVNDSFVTVFVSYEDLASAIDKDSEIWQKMIVQ